ncbi:MAG: HDIG domain-containing protein [Anaerolineales bacterium]|nr:HDIG domain-containing protein [Anaerolineales bacterium]MCX7608317.1 HDIG domain-containing protein [Anaerolineales bacterium]MDW8227346.1 HDIG domain-containing protein [Anaerolineales bacterium]
MTPVRKSNLFSLVILICTAILSFVALNLPWSLRQGSLTLKVGDVADQDLRAPRTFSYISAVLTDQAQDAAERAVAPVYEPPDLSIGRTQTQILSRLLQQIQSLRDDEGKTYEQKIAELQTLRAEPFSLEAATLLLTLPTERWTLVENEAIGLLGRVMRNAVRSEDIPSLQEKLPSMVSFTLNEQEAELVVELVSPLIVANSFYSPELTEQARQAARNAVEPVTQSYLEGQAIVLRGQVITEVAYEALAKAGLIQTQPPFYEYLAIAALVLVLTVLTALYFIRRRSDILSDLRALLLLSFLFLLFLFSARIVTANRTILPYLFPLPAFALLVSILYGMERGMVFGLLLSLLASYGWDDTLGIFPYYLISSLCGVLVLGEARRVIHFFYAILAIAASGAAVILGYRLVFTSTDWIGLVTLLGAAVVYGVLSSATVWPLQYVFAQFLGIVTPLQLLDLSRPENPLLKYFLQRAPGTYQHSLQVANLAEQAAEQIQADALLTRVGALFHDIGKAANPAFFVENQPPANIDAHDDLPPEESAAIIIRHVADGLALARKYRLPKRLQDFIAEHHGTMLTRYQYNRALQAVNGDASKIDESRFRYPGPKPRSKETALLMFADGVEARVRAENPRSDEEMRAIVRNVVETRQKDGQLEDTPLTQRDLNLIIESFVTALRMTYHPRLEYPSEIPVPRNNTTKKREQPA